jgi:hypothetical protein
MKVPAAPGIDFADSRFESQAFTDDDVLYIYVLSWKETKITMKFQEAIYFSYNLGDQLSNFYEVSGDSLLLEDAVNRYYSKRTYPHPLKLYQFEDLHDFPFIQIVAKSLEVILSGVKR